LQHNAWQRTLQSVVRQLQRVCLYHFSLCRVQRTATSAQRILSTVQHIHQQLKAHVHSVITVIPSEPQWNQLIYWTYLNSTDRRQQLKQFIVNTATVNKAAEQLAYPAVIVASIRAPNSCYIHFRSEFLPRIWTRLHLCNLHFDAKTWFKHFTS